MLNHRKIRFAFHSTRVAPPAGQARLLGNGSPAQCFGFLGLVWAWLVLNCLTGCARFELPAQLPSKNVLSAPQFLVYSDFTLPPEHRLIGQLTGRKADLEAALDIEFANEPIHVYLFADEASFSRYARQQLPGFAGRRALFVKTDTRLMVLAHWHDQLGEDLRHEMVHGYLHATLPWLPLWLDEGLAEYFESPALAETKQARHIAHLASEFRVGRWQPNLERLEAFEEATLFGETQYAESWLWTHFLLSTTPERSAELQEFVRLLQSPGSPSPQFSEQLGAIRGAWELELLTHLKELAGELVTDSTSPQPERGQ